EPLDALEDAGHVAHLEVGRPLRAAGDLGQRGEQALGLEPLQRGLILPHVDDAPASVVRAGDVGDAPCGGLVPDLVLDLAGHLLGDPWHVLAERVHGPLPSIRGLLYRIECYSNHMSGPVKSRIYDNSRREAGALETRRAVVD